MHDEHLDHIRHSLAHLLAATVLRKYPETKLGIGPTTENGFYYDLLIPAPVSTEDLKTFEKGMRKMITSKLPFTGKKVTPEEAKAGLPNQPFKHELIDDFAREGRELTLYQTGEYFTDLCRGGHVENTSEIDPEAFKLTKLAGAYWKGDESNQQMTRIYGVAFNTKADLDAYEAMMAEAEKRDHKKLGRELGLFTISPLVGPGLPLMQPKGMVIRKAVEDFLWELHKNRGYARVWTPHIAKEELYIASGHASKFGDELFRVQGKEDKFIMKPMNCPHHMQLFADNQLSYRQMPVRYFEPATVYRDEKSGQLGGLTRVRAITQDDGHLFCRTSQIKDEVSAIVSIIRQFYTVFGMMDEYWVSLSVRGEDKTKYLGSDSVWETAENALEEAARANNLNYRRVAGEAAFYGPKLDFMFKDAIGREWQLATIQCDFNLPERFELSFTNEKGEAERPVVIHRAISGSLERFMGILIEHYAGDFPLWLSPEQITVIPIAEAHHAYAHEIAARCSHHDLRVVVDDSNDTLGKRIRTAKTSKVPYIIVVGEAEASEHTVTIESRKTGEKKTLPLDDCLVKLKMEVRDRI